MQSPSISRFPIPTSRTYSDFSSKVSEAELMQ
jgi:hypothetical protein